MWTRREMIVSSIAGLGAVSRGAAAVQTLGRDVPWLSEVQSVPAGPPSALPPLHLGERGIPLSRVEWERKGIAIRQKWIDYLGTVSVPKMNTEYDIIKEDRLSGCVRQLIRYEVEPEVITEAYLILPAEKPLGRRVPGVVAMHSTVNHTIRQPAGVEGKPEKFFGLKLARRGMATISPRCFLWQDSGDYKQQVKIFKERHPGVTGMAKMLYDAQRALDILLSVSQVDPDRIGAVGHSLGAKEALYLAAFDERVKVTVSSEGGIGIGFSNWDAEWYLGAAANAPDFPLKHHELLALSAPRPFLLLGGDSADGAISWPYIKAALPIYRLYGAPARLGLFNHKQGHSVPPIAEKRIEEWLLTYLAVGKNPK